MIGIVTPDAPVFLAIVTVRSNDDREWNRYPGIFASKGAARAAVNRELKCVRHLTVVSTSVRRGFVEWGDEV